MEEPQLGERDEQVKNLLRRLNENFRGIAHRQHYRDRVDRMVHFCWLNAAVSTREFMCRPVTVANY